MIDAAYIRLVKDGLVDWGVIFHGLSGIPGHAERLPIDMMCRFALGRLRLTVKPVFGE